MAPTTTRADRGQTSLDFVVGVSVFLLTLALVFGFVPQLFAPFDADHEQPLVADRVADRLADGLLGSPAPPSTLEGDCVSAFFGAGTATGCGFDPSDPVTDRVGIGDRYELNVSIRRDIAPGNGTELLCTDSSGVGPCAGGTRLAAGAPVPTDHDSVSTARRIRTVDGRDVTLVVRVW